MIRTLRQGLADTWRSTAARMREESVDEVDRSIEAGYSTVLSEVAAFRLALADLIEALAEAVTP